MADYNALSILKEGPFVIRLTPCTYANGEVTGFGTYRDFTAVADGEVEFKNSETTQEYYERRLSSNKTIKIAKTNSYVGINGASTPAASEGGDTVKFTGIFEYDDIKFFISLMRSGTSVPVVISFPLAFTSTDGVPGWGHLLCKFQGNFAVGSKEGIMEIPVTFQGGVTYTPASGVDYTDFNTASVTSKKITPHGFDEGDTPPTTGAFTISALVEADGADFWGGNIVLKDV